MIKRKYVAAAGGLVATSASLMFGTPVQAQETSINGVEEIVVTARKRSENLRDVPASIVALSERQIESLNANSLADLTRVVPNFTIDESGSITIRGIQSFTRNAGFESGAAVYIDGVFQGRPVGNNQNLADIERVEVLRGPQGTLYGKNTTAGAISLVTVRPGDSFTGKAELRFGERNDRLASGYVAGPLTDSTGLKLSAYRRSADGYIRNVANGDDYANTDTSGARVELRLHPENWDISLRGDYVDDQSVPNLGKVVSGFAAPLAPGFDDVNYDVPARLSHKGGGVSLTAERDLNDYIFTSVSAWRKLQASSTFDDDYTPLDVFHHDFMDDSMQLSQEVRLASPASGRLTYVVGAYFFRQELESDRPGFAGAVFPIPGSLTDRADVDTDAYAIFANGDYRFTDALTLNVGMRYTSERKHLDFEQDATAGLPFPDIVMTDRFTDEDLSPTVSLTYKFTPDVTTYLKASRGFKSGGWNPDITLTRDIRFDAESVNNYELGLRVRSFDGRMDVSLTGYSMDYEDLQVQQFLGTLVGNVITNAGEATIRGVELEVQARPADWLNLSVGGAYTDATYDRFDSGTGASYAGQQIADTPKVTAYALAEARFPIAAATDLILQTDYSSRSKAYFDDARTVSAGLPFSTGGYGLLNARVGIMQSNGLELFVYGQNLTDKRVLEDRMNDALGLGLVIDMYGPPRQYGVRFGYKF